MVINYGDDCTDLRGSTELAELLPRLLAVLERHLLTVLVDVGGDAGPDGD